jgi:FMN phosphatase YigB (HAD superfamily)
VNVVLIDLDDTLIADAPVTARAVTAALAAVGLPHGPAAVAAAVRTIRKMWKSHPHRHTRALAQVSAWDALWLPRHSLPPLVAPALAGHELQTWAAVLSGQSRSPDAVGAAAHAYRTARSRLLQPLPGVRSALARLSDHHTLWLTTNGLPAHQRAKLTGAGLDVFFTRVMVSGDVGASKADPQFAATVARHLAGAHVCRVIGDSTTQDLALAANGGWPAAHICGTGTCQAAGIHDVDPVLHVKALGDLPDCC